MGFLQSNCPKDILKIPKKFRNVNDTLKQHPMRTLSANIHVYFFHDLEFKFLYCFAHYGKKFKL